MLALSSMVFNTHTSVKILEILVWGFMTPSVDMAMCGQICAQYLRENRPVHIKSIRSILES